MKQHIWPRNCRWIRHAWERQDRWRIFPVVQWLRLWTPNVGSPVPSLVEEWDPTCCNERFQLPQWWLKIQCTVNFRGLSKGINSDTHWKYWCWNWSSDTLAIWFEEPTHWKRPWCWERLKAGGQGMTKDEMVGWHHQLNGHESEQTRR